MTTLTVGIGGPSCSGKSTLCLHLLALLTPLVPTSLINQDEFFKPDAQIPLHPSGIANWDSRDAVLSHAFYAEIRDQRSDLVKTRLQINKNISTPEPLPLDGVLSATIASSLERKRICKVTIVDGFLAYDYSENDNVYDLRMFLYCPYATLKSRRETRTVYVTKDGTWEDPPKYFENIVWPEFTKNNAPILPLVETARESGTRVSVSGRSYTIVKSDEAMDAVFNVGVAAVVDAIDRLETSKDKTN